MAIKHKIASALGSVTKSLIRVTGRGQASNFPGRVALKFDSDFVREAVPEKVSGKKVVVVGTNGKTSTTNLIADILEHAGKSVICNRTGANMMPGITTALLGSSKADMGVFECDELWLKDVLPCIEADFVVLLNLFRDQLDRCGEIERIKDSILSALERTPKAQLIYNADDPICAEIALSALNMASQKKSKANIAFGIDEPLNISNNSIADSSICPKCGELLDYEFRQYDKLGNYYCNYCDFKKPALTFSATSNKLMSDGCEFQVKEMGESYKIALQGAYNIYNALACITLMQELGVEKKSIDEVFASFKPQNGRLQSYSINGKKVLLNLAKNPTGFNQNLKIITNSVDKVRGVAIGFFINDKIADGRDVSWLWDVDFEEMANINNATFFAGGTRKHDMQVRLKYAGVSSFICDNVDEMVESDADEAYIIANYTALPVVKARLDELSSLGNVDLKSLSQLEVSSFNKIMDSSSIHKGEQKYNLRIAHMYPDLLNLYGDGGNVRILQKRCEWRGIDVEIMPIRHGDSVNLSNIDIVFMGGSPDREQKIATTDFMNCKAALQQYIESGGVLLAICGSYQILGSTWLCDGQEVEGLGILPIHTERPGTSGDRLTNNIALKSDIADLPVVGYENHAGRTVFNDGNIVPFGKVISNVGCGNNEEMHADGVIYKNAIGTYLHGPLLSKNPEVADHLIKIALMRKFGSNCELSKLDDEIEIAANNYMANLLIP